MVRLGGCCLALWLLPCSAAATGLQLSPVVCTSAEQGDCVVSIDVQWQRDVLMCLRRQDTQALLVCGHAGAWQLELRLQQDLHLEWIQQPEQTLVERRYIKILRSVAEDHPLHNRRLSWSLF